MRGGLGKYTFFIVLILGSFKTSAQEILVRGGFVEDSLVIGQNINYWITAKYPPQLEMVFPDSNASFSPFEFSSKEYFPSKLMDGQAFDSTVYTLQSFEIDLVQYLQLDAVILFKADSSVIKSPLDSIFLAELAPVVTDTTSLKTNLAYQDVAGQFNYPLLYYIVGGLILISAILLLIFGKKIVQYFKLKKMAKDYQNFSEALDGYVSNLKREPKPEIAETALSHWKKYQQKLDKIAFTTLTSKEILKLKFTNELENPLRSIDRMVYGKKENNEIYLDFQLIENFAQERYQKRVDEIRYGK